MNTSGAPHHAALRDQLIARVWQSRDDSLIELERVASELPSGLAQRQVKDLMRVWKDCKSESDIKKHPRILEWITCLIQPKSPESRARLQRFVERISVKHDRYRQVLHLIAYPIVLISVSAAVLLLFVFTVVPAFDEMFQEFGIRLPASTELLLSISRAVQHLGGPVILFCFLILIGWAWWLLRCLRDSYNHQLQRTGMFSWYVSRQRSADAFHDLKDFQEIGLPKAEAVAVVRDRLDGRFYHAIDSPKPMVSIAVQNADLPSALRALLSVRDANSLEVDDPTINQQLATAWAHIHQSRITHRTHQHWFILFDFGLKLVVGCIIAFVLQSLFGPLVSLITGLT